jgi:hypothetical protein
MELAEAAAAPTPTPDQPVLTSAACFAEAIIKCSVFKRSKLNRLAFLSYEISGDLCHLKFSNVRTWPVVCKSFFSQLQTI